jgi:hypothetical protein
VRFADGFGGVDDQIYHNQPELAGITYDRWCMW